MIYWLIITKALTKSIQFILLHQFTDVCLTWPESFPMTDAKQLGHLISIPLTITNYTVELLYVCIYVYNYSLSAIFSSFPEIPLSYFLNKQLCHHYSSVILGLNFTRSVYCKAIVSTYIIKSSAQFFNSFIEMVPNDYSMPYSFYFLLL